MPIDLTTTNLEGKDYSNRDLRDCDLSRHRCMRANFSGADLRGVSFREADCTGAIFTGAKLDGADFTGAIGAPAQLNEEVPTVTLDGSSATLYVDSGSPVLWQLETSKKELEEEVALLRQQLDDALAEIRRLTEGVPDENEQERPTRRRRGKA